MLAPAPSWWLLDGLRLSYARILRVSILVAPLLLYLLNVNLGSYTSPISYASILCSRPPWITKPEISFAHCVASCWAVGRCSSHYTYPTRKMELCAGSGKWVVPLRPWSLNNSTIKQCASASPGCIYDSGRGAPPWWIIYCSSLEKDCALHQRTPPCTRFLPEMGAAPSFQWNSLEVRYLMLITMAFSAVVWWL